MIFKDLASMVHDQGEIIGKQYSMSVVIYPQPKFDFKLGDFQPE